jgi:potassium/hydrogen antiporter
MGELILIAGLLMTAALTASLLAGRLRVPGLLLFLAVGMLVGSDGLGWLDFDDYELARDIGIVALAVILYEGGLTTVVAQMRPVILPAASLAVLATLLTAVITGFAASALFGFPLLEGLLLGSIVASTDAAAIFALLRGSSLKPRLARLLEGEAGSNDPVAVLLVVGFIEWIEHPGYGVPDMALLFVSQLGIGTAAGLAVGLAGGWALRRTILPTVGLYPVASLTIGAVAFGLADVLGGSGFLAIYLAGLVLAGASIPAKRTIVAFHGGLAWVAQLAMFLTLGLLVFPSQLASIALEGIALALVLAFVARPVASVAATAFTSMSVNERIVLGWAGLRGAVPVVLATFPVIAGVPESLEFFNIVFFAVVASLLVQGPTFEPLAHRLGVITSEPPPSEPIIEVGVIRRLGAETVEYPVGDDHAVVGAHVRDLGLPRDAVVNVIVRRDEAIAPRGSTRVRAGDRLHILVRREVTKEVDALMERWRRGPIGPPPRPRRRIRGTPPVFTVRRADAGAIVGDAHTPEVVLGQPVVARMRVRRDLPGALVALEDGRYAVTGPVLVVGSREDVATYARRRAQRADPDERAWLQTVVGALAIDVFDAMPVQRGAGGAEQTAAAPGRADGRDLTERADRMGPPAVGAS